MNNPKSGADQRPRLAVVIPVLVVFLGIAYLVFKPKIKPAREEATSTQADEFSAAPSPGTNGATEVVRRSAKFSVPTPRSAASRRQVFEQPKETIGNQRGTAAPTSSVESPASAPPDGAVLFAPGVEIGGTVTLQGRPPPEITIDMSADPKCGALHSSPTTTRHYLVNENGGLANVFVYLKSGLASQIFPTPAVSPLLDQIACVYEPYVMGVTVNQKFRIRNSDPLLHNVHPTPRANKEFNFAQPLKDMVSERSFDKPEVLVRFKCDVHPWMFAYVGVVEHPFFAVTGKDGTFALPLGLPPGAYAIEAFHLKVGAMTKDIQVTVGEKKTVDFTFQVPSNQ